MTFVVQVYFIRRIYVCRYRHFSCDRAFDQFPFETVGKRQHAWVLPFCGILGAVASWQVSKSTFSPFESTTSRTDLCRQLVLFVRIYSWPIIQHRFEREKVYWAWGYGKPLAVLSTPRLVVRLCLGYIHCSYLISFLIIRMLTSR